MTATPEQLLEGESFDDETFVGFDLARADLSGKAFAGCTFRNVKLPESRWAGARLEDCVLEACDLTRLAPAEMALRGVQFNRCKMMGIDWTGVGQYPDLSFADCNLDYCSFTSLRGAGSRSRAGASAGACTGAAGAADPHPQPKTVHPSSA